VNVLLLWAEATDRGFTSPYWLTFRQALELKGHVRKGETGSVVVYSKQLTKTVLDEAGEVVEEARFAPEKLCRFQPGSNRRAASRLLSESARAP